MHCDKIWWNQYIHIFSQIDNPKLLGGLQFGLAYWGEFDGKNKLNIGRHEKLNLSRNIEA